MRKIPLLVLVGGLGTRLNKIYPDIPKFLVPINENNIFADFWIKSLDYSCISHIYFLTGYKSEMIENYLVKKKLPVSFTVLSEGQSLLGTGGAIKKACKKLNSSFFVTYGDSILDLNWGRMMERFFYEDKPLILSIIFNSGLTDASNINLNNNEIYYNKRHKNSDMNFIDYGLSIINIKDFKRTTSRIEKFDLSDWFHYITLFNPNIPYLEANGRYFEIGTPTALEEFRRNFKHKN